MKNDSLGNRFKLSWDIRRKYPLAASDTPPAPPPTAHRPPPTAQVLGKIAL